MHRIYKICLRCAKCQDTIHTFESFWLIPIAERCETESAAACLLELWVRIPPAAPISVSYECYVLSGRGLWVRLIALPEGSTKCGVSECNLQASIMGKPWPSRGWCTMKNKSFFLSKRLLINVYPIVNCYIAVSSLTSHDNAQYQFHESSLHLFPPLADATVSCFILMLVHRSSPQGHHISHPLISYYGGTQRI